MQLSKLENEAYETLRKNNLLLFKIKDLCLLLNVDKTKSYNIVKALKKKKAIKGVGKGFLAFSDVDEFVIAVNLNWPSYISFWSALNYYNFSDQMPKKIFLATTKYTKETKDFKYVTLSKKRFFGYVNINGIVIAEKEKAIIDSLLLLKYSGGIKEIIKSVEGRLGSLDKDKLIDYALKIESKAVLRRLGFILESFNFEEKDLNKIKKKIGKGFELLDPNLKKKNNLNKKWMLDINID